ncbi:NAD(P)H-binding protein [Actinosynnema sp. CS-041913]|uniref:NmrA family NAD(P)-binding protein n=1 Tax=Actinosynnema sp. CS-041913 TaxID=3239917 RepID=UPI003D94D178
MTYLVTGATGKAGRQVVAHLLRDGHRVRALTRDPARADLPGVEVVRGDLTEPDTLKEAFEGVTGVHLLTVGGDDYATLTTGPEIMALAAASGVRRVSVLWNGEPGPVEEAVEASGLEWTVLQPTDFMSNTLTWAARIRASGVVDEPFADVRTAVVDEGDVGAVAAAVLTRDGHAGRRYSLTGPAALSPREKLAMIGTAVGRPLTFDELSTDQARERSRQAGLSPELIELLLTWHGNPPPEAYTVTSAVEDVLGRPPRSFASWAAEHAASFR